MLHLHLHQVLPLPLTFAPMYSRQEASQLRQQFWTAFGQYMSPVLSADGEKVNWINYKTGIRGIAFRMDADTERATIAIEISGKDPNLQQRYFQQFQQLSSLLYEALGDSWNEQPYQQDAYGNTTSRIYTQLQNISIFRREDWPQLISFFKPRIIALDAFWSTARYVFEAL